MPERVHAVIHFQGKKHRYYLVNLTTFKINYSIAITRCCDSLYRTVRKYLNFITKDENRELYWKGKHILAEDHIHSYLKLNNHSKLQMRRVRTTLVRRRIFGLQWNGWRRMWIEGTLVSLEPINSSLADQGILFLFLFSLERITWMRNRERNLRSKQSPYLFNQ